MTRPHLRSDQLIKAYLRGRVAKPVPADFVPAVLARVKDASARRPKERVLPLPEPPRPGDGRSADERH